MTWSKILEVIYHDTFVRCYQRVDMHIKLVIAISHTISTPNERWTSIKVCAVRYHMRLVDVETEQQVTSTSAQTAIKSDACP